MALPGVIVSISDGALGLISESADNIPLHIGVASSGTADVLLSFSDQKGLADALGTGPLVEAAARSLAEAGGPVNVWRIGTTTAGTKTSVTKTGTGTATGTLSGNPLDEFDAKVEVLTAGANLAALTAAVRYTLDGGDNWSPPLAMPVGGAIVLPGTGLTLTFADGTFVVGDLHTFTTTAPTYSLATLQAALDAIQADPRTWGFIHVVGAAASVSATASMIAALETKLAAMAAAFRYTFAVIQVAEDTDANIIAGLAASASKRVLPVAGAVDDVSPLSGLIRKRPAAWFVAARLARAPISEDLGRVASGPLSGITKLFRDEAAAPALDAQRIATLRTHVGLQGFFITNGNLLSPAGSDFRLVQHRRVMDRACAVVRAALLRYLNESVALDPQTGRILERVARAIEADVRGQLEAAVVAPGHVSAASVVIDRTANILSTATMPVSVRVLPKGYAKLITVDIGFTNPALSPAAS